MEDKHSTNYHTKNGSAVREWPYSNVDFQSEGIWSKCPEFQKVLTGVTQWTEHRTVKQRVAGWILGRGTCLGCRPGPLV